jgi:pimeloyl-ACP methyl ester carboxylesterase
VQKKPLQFPKQSIPISSSPLLLRIRPRLQTPSLIFIEAGAHCGDSNIAKITAPVLIISGDNDGTDKIELIKTYQLPGGGASADLQPMPKSHVAIVPSQGHVSLMMQTKTILGYLDDFLK